MSRVSVAFVFRPWFLMFALLGFSAKAWSAPSQKRENVNEAMDALAAAVMDGQGSLNAVLSRIQYLGAEATASVTLARWAQQSTSTVQLRRVAEALSQVADPIAEPTLLGLLANKDGAVRMRAAQGLGRIKSSLAGKRLVPLLKDSSLGVRKEAARSLGVIPFRPAARDILKAAQKEKEVETRVEMLLAVGALGDRRNAEPLQPFLNASSEVTQRAAAHALCRLGAKSGFQFVERLLASPEKSTRLSGVKLLEEVSEARAKALLRQRLEDDAIEVAAVAARILHQLGETQMLEWLVTKSAQSRVDDQLVIEKELETLRLSDEARRDILTKAGLR